MSHTYIVLWSQKRCEWLRSVGREGMPVEVMFGGEHTSRPRFSSFGVQAGDSIVPVILRDGVLYLAARLRVTRFLSLTDYLQEFLELPATKAKTWSWDLEDQLWATRPAERYRLPTGCVDEAAVGTCDAPLRWDRAIPPEVLATIRLESKRGEQRGLNHVVDDRLTSHVGLQGKVYRLSAETAAEFEKLLDDRRRVPVTPAEKPVEKRSFYLPPGTKMRLLRRGEISGTLRKAYAPHLAGDIWRASIALYQTPCQQWYSIVWDVKLAGERDFFYGSSLNADVLDLQPDAEPTEWMMNLAAQELRRCKLGGRSCLFTVTATSWQDP